MTVIKTVFSPSVSLCRLLIDICTLQESGNIRTNLPPRCPFDAMHDQKVLSLVSAAHPAKELHAHIGIVRCFQKKTPPVTRPDKLYLEVLDIHYHLVEESA